MGRKSRKKYHAKKLSKQKGQPLEPDDYMSFGPIQFARFGRFVVSKNTMSQAEHAKFQEEAAARYPIVCKEIDEIIRNIVKITRTLQPQDVLKRAFWEMAYHHMNVEAEIDAGLEAVLSLRMLDYIQSIIVSVRPIKPYKTEIEEEVWQRLNKNVEELFAKLNLDYHICHSAYRRLNDPGYNKNYDEYYFKAQTYWCNIRGHRSPVHEIPHLKGILSPHNDIFQKLFEIDVSFFLNELAKIQNSLMLGIDRTMRDLGDFHSDSIEMLEKEVNEVPETPFREPQEIMSDIIQDNKWESRVEDIMGRFVGLDLFDLKKVTDLPQTLLRELSWEPGENSSFFAEGDFKGWPLRVWPIFERPFIKIDDHFYCFELYSLFDHIYRAMQRLICRLEPSYTVVWNDKQKEVSESIPMNLFKKLLPGAKEYSSVYYKWHTSPGARKQWCESDGLLIYGDNLFLVEVKAGAFTHTPPATDFPAHLDSIKNLIVKPAEQGARFIEYLKSAKRVEIHDNGHKVVGTLEGSSFKNIIVCAVTLDPITEIAAQTEHLGEISIEMGRELSWNLSVDDLRIYSEVFTNPLIFVHFVEQRIQAIKSGSVKLDDELDHLGLYLKHNIYSQYAEEINPSGNMQWLGYRARIEKYFTKKYHDPDLEEQVRQWMHPRFSEIIEILYKTHGAKATRVSSILLDCSGEWRDKIANYIEDNLKHQLTSKRPRPFSVYGEVNITIFCWQDGVVRRDAKLAVDHAMAASLAVNEKNRLLIELSYSRDGNLKRVDYEFITLTGLSSIELDRLRVIAEKLIKNRHAAATAKEGKIGRNQPCPCGSGRKYKKCCLRSA